MTPLLCWETIHQNSSEFESYISLLNTFITGAGFAVLGKCDRVEENLKSKCYATLHTFRSSSGWKKHVYACQQCFKMNPVVNEVLSLEDVCEDYS